MVFCMSGKKVMDKERSQIFYGFPQKLDRVSSFTHANGVSSTRIKLNRPILHIKDIKSQRREFEFVGWHISGCYRQF